MIEKTEYDLLLTQFFTCIPKDEKIYISQLAERTKTLVIDIDSKQESTFSCQYHLNNARTTTPDYPFYFLFFLANLIPCIFPGGINFSNEYNSYDKLLTLINSKQFDLIICTHLYFNFENHCDYALKTIKKELDDNHRTAVDLQMLDFDRAPKMSYSYNPKFDAAEQINQSQIAIKEKSKSNEIHCKYRLFKQVELLPELKNIIFECLICLYFPETNCLPMGCVDTRMNSFIT